MGRCQGNLEWSGVCVLRGGRELNPNSSSIHLNTLYLKLTKDAADLQQSKALFVCVMAALLCARVCVCVCVHVYVCVPVCHCVASVHPIFVYVRAHAEQDSPPQHEDGGPPAQAVAPVELVVRLQDGPINELDGIEHQGAGLEDRCRPTTHSPQH